MKKVLVSLLALALWGCATATPQSEDLLSAAQATAFVPRAHGIENIPFVEQTAGYCGPATLSMAMGALGKPISPDELARQVYTPNMKGTLQEDMISASRRQGFLAIPMSGLRPLLMEVAAGHAVIVFENLALSWLPQWHYAIVFGYDLDAQTVTMHSGPEANKHWDLRRFERSWQLADYWGLIILRPGELSTSAGEWDHVKAAAALEKIGKNEEAEKSYRAIRERWPKSLVAGIGLANIVYAKGNPREAARILQQVVKDHPDSTEARHNLVVALAQVDVSKKSETIH